MRSRMGLGTRTWRQPGLGKDVRELDRRARRELRRLQDLRTKIFMYVCISLSLSLSIYLHIYTYISIHTYIYIYTYMYIYI